MGQRDASTTAARKRSNIRIFVPYIAIKQSSLSTLTVPQKVSTRSFAHIAKPINCPSVNFVKLLSPPLLQLFHHVCTQSLDACSAPGSAPQSALCRGTHAVKRDDLPDPSVLKAIYTATLSHIITINFKESDAVCDMLLCSKASLNKSRTKRCRANNSLACKSG